MRMRALWGKPGAWSLSRCFCFVLLNWFPLLWICLFVWLVSRVCLRESDKWGNWGLSDSKGRFENIRKKRREIEKCRRLQPDCSKTGNKALLIALNAWFWTVERRAFYCAFNKSFLPQINWWFPSIRALGMHPGQVSSPKLKKDTHTVHSHVQFRFFNKSRHAFLWLWEETRITEKEPIHTSEGTHKRLKGCGSNVDFRFAVCFIVILFWAKTEGAFLSSWWTVKFFELNRKAIERTRNSTWEVCEVTVPTTHLLCHNNNNNNIMWYYWPVSMASFQCSLVLISLAFTAFLFCEQIFHDNNLQQCYFTYFNF